MTIEHVMTDIKPGDATTMSRMICERFTPDQKNQEISLRKLSGNIEENYNSNL